MKRRSKLVNLKLTALFFVACSFVFTPLASALHAQHQIDATCAVDFESADHDEPASHDDHDHHAHYCGQCHIHIHRSDFNTHGQIEESFTKLRPPLAEGKVQRRSTELYRPPKP